ncbi:MAG: alanine racemase [Spirochaetes bacterium GWB1_59_5]|nr:MAG: alanine racemase [Spirochaetes bacterium GWB1_59_5]
MMERPTWAEVDTAAIRGNIQRIAARLSPGVSVCAVVKADGYGHGALAVARVALEAGASMLAVALVNEAAELRAAGFVCPILVLGPTEACDAARIVDLGLDTTVYELSAARALSDAAVSAGASVGIHLKIDTGMRRVGCEPEAAASIAAAIAALPAVRLAGVFSHFATADAEDLGFAREQLGRYEAALAAIKAADIDPGIRHLANSAAAIRMPEAGFDMVRLGIAMYGLKPSADRAWEVELLPAMSFKTRVSMVKDVSAGESVGYGRRFYAARKSRIATLPLGYADGWPRALSGRVSLLVRGKRAPLVGSVCMDQCMLDVTDVPGVSVGDEVLLYGAPELPADEIAAALGTINYEVVCLVGKRVPRVYLPRG